MHKKQYIVSPYACCYFFDGYLIFGSGARAVSIKDVNQQKCMIEILDNQDEKFSKNDIFEKYSLRYDEKKYQNHFMH